MFKIYGNIWGWYVFLQVALCLVAICITFQSSSNSLGMSARACVYVLSLIAVVLQVHRNKRQKCHFQCGLALPFQFVAAINIWECTTYIERSCSSITVIKVKDSFLYFYRYWLLQRTNQTLFLSKRNSSNAKKLLYCQHYSSSNSFFSTLTLYSVPSFFCFIRTCLIDFKMSNGCFSNSSINFIFSIYRQ